MIIKSLKMVGLFGKTFKFAFSPGLNAIIGPNGSGMTTTLNVLAGLTGNAEATRLLHYYEFTTTKIVIYNEGQRIEKTFRGPKFDMDEVTAFKATLPVRSSFILPEDELESRYVSETLCPKAAIETMRTTLRDAKIPLNLFYRDGHSMTFHMRPGSGQYHIAAFALRLPPPGIPYLAERPERHLSIHVKRVFANHFFGKRNQAFITTHDPEMFCELERLGAVSHDLSKLQ